MTNLISDPLIIEAIRDLQDWIDDERTPLFNHIAHIHKQRLELHLAKYEDHGEFINQWVRLGTHQKLQQIPSISSYTIECLNKFISK